MLEGVKKNGDRTLKKTTRTAKVPSSSMALKEPKRAISGALETTARFTGELS
jgi:hypothetical protein